MTVAYICECGQPVHYERTRAGAQFKHECSVSAPKLGSDRPASASPGTGGTILNPSSPQPPTHLSDP